MIYTHGSLFSGAGGFDVAAEIMGWENKFHCEINPYCKIVLKYFWPEALSYDDIKQTDFTIWRGRIDVLTGGFPCQPYSVAGKRKGKEDERHLWPEMLRAIKEIRPRWIVGENVYGLINWSGGLVFHEIQSELETAGYEVFPYVLPACGVGAPHKRYRIWFVAKDTHQNGWSRDLREEEPEIGGQRQPGTGDHEQLRTNNEKVMANAGSRGQQGPGQSIGPSKPSQGSNRQANRAHYDRKGTWVFGDWEQFPTQPPILGRNDGFPTKLNGISFSDWRKESIKMYGNAVVPQLVIQIFKTIEDFDKQNI